MVHDPARRAAPSPLTRVVDDHVVDVPGALELAVGLSRQAVSDVLASGAFLRSIADLLGARQSPASPRAHDVDLASCRVQDGSRQRLVAGSLVSTRNLRVGAGQRALDRVRQLHRPRSVVVLIDKTGCRERHVGLRASRVAD